MTVAASPSATAMMISRRPPQALDGAPEGRGPAGRSTWAGRRAMPVFYSAWRIGQPPSSSQRWALGHPHRAALGHRLRLVLHRLALVGHRLGLVLHRLALVLHRHLGVVHRA